MHQRPTASASEAILAVTRLLDEGAGSGDPTSVAAALVREARQLFAVRGAMLLLVDPQERAVLSIAAEPPGSPAVRQLDDLPALRDLLDLRLAVAHAAGDEASRLGVALGWSECPDTALLVPMRVRDSLSHVLVLADQRPSAFAPEEQELARSFAGAAAGALAQLRLAEEHAQRIAQLSALTRAARSLNESLDLAYLLETICREARAIIDADASVIYLGDRESGLVAEAADNVGRASLAGYRLAPGKGLASRVAQTGEAELINDYQTVIRPAPESPFADVHSALAVPMTWDGELRGVLSLGYRRPFVVTGEELHLLETFAELAAAACRNANAAAGLALAARTDGLTGCLNHAALQDGLRREVERAERSGHPISVLLVDLDDFKQVNERHGHLMGDEVLRRVGHSLRSVVRPYDLCARYGGDEFAIVCIDAGEQEAGEIAGRALDRLAAALGDVEEAAATAATIGLACRAPGEGPTHLLEQADRALLYGKQEGSRGAVVTATLVPDSFRPGRFRREGRAAAELHRGTDPAAALEPGAAQAQRLQKRTRQLVLANALAARLAAMNDRETIINAAVDELHRAFGYFLCAVIEIREDGYVQSAAGRGEAFVRLGAQRWTQPRSAGIIGRALRERRIVMVNDISREPDYCGTPETDDTRAELVSPIWVGERLWGAVNIEERFVDAFDEDDARLVQTVADLVGSALRSALLYEQLERAYLGTAEALSSAVEAKGAAHEPQHRSIVAWCEAVGRRLGVTEDGLRELRYAAALHDVGRLSIPEALLAKPGPLTAEERAVVERHPVVGERILAPVEFLAPVRRTVRHTHERWDGTGYPDGLAGEAIPLHSRIVLVCDAYDAMTSERPYRPALDESMARAELERHAGSQFDPAAVTALLAVLDGSA